MSRVARWLPLLAVSALLGAAMLAAMFGNPVIERLPPLTLEMTPPNPSVTAIAGAEPSLAPSTPPANPDSTPPLPGWVNGLVSGLCVVVVIVLLWLLVRDRLIQRRVRRLEGVAAADVFARAKRRVSAALDEGIADLDDADADPRRAVIACWVRLERAAALVGSVRGVSDTSTDLVARLLLDHQVSAEILDRFAAIYRAARFGAHEVDPNLRDQARAALRQLRDELSVGVR